jgi:hypothetical protein
LKCRIDQNLECREIFKTGSGKWDFSKGCLKCETFISNGQFVFNKTKNGEIEMKDIKEIPEWIKTRSVQQKQDTSSEYFKIPEGESEIEINELQAPEEVEGNFGKQYMYYIKADGKRYKLTVGKMLDVMIIKALMKGINPMIVIRAGTGIQTRYSIKGLK